MRLWSLRCSLVALGVAGLVGAGLPAAAGGASPGAAASGSPAVGDRCLIGTWRDNGGLTSTRFLGHAVKMRTHGGDFDHISASGRDRASWASSKPLVGKFRGHRLTERVRGANTMRLRAHGGTLVEIERGWSAHSTNRYLYRGQHTSGYLNQTGRSRARFRCTLQTLTFLDRHGRVRGHETRVSFKP